MIAKMIGVSVSIAILRRNVIISLLEDIGRMMGFEKLVGDDMEEGGYIWAWKMLFRGYLTPDWVVYLGATINIMLVVLSWFV